MAYLCFPGNAVVREKQEETKRISGCYQRSSHGTCNAGSMLHAFDPRLNRRTFIVTSSASISPTTTRKAILTEMTMTKSSYRWRGLLSAVVLLSPAAAYSSSSNGCQSRMIRVDLTLSRFIAIIGFVGGGVEFPLPSCKVPLDSMVLSEKTQFEIPPLRCQRDQHPGMPNTSLFNTCSREILQSAPQPSTSLCPFLRLCRFEIVHSMDRGRGL